MSRRTEFSESDIELKPLPQLVPRPETRPPWEEKIDLVRQLCAPGATNTEFELFCYQAKRTGLDPLAKQIYCIRRWNHKTEQMQMTIQTGIDGFRVTADRTGKYAGSEKPIFYYEKNTKALVKAFIRVWKMVGGQRCAFEAEAYWDEYCPKSEKEAFFWKKMPHGQLSKCAEALALRKAFPAELSGVYIHEEMEQAGPIANGIDGPPVEGTKCTDCGKAVVDWQYGTTKKQMYTGAQILVISQKLHNANLCGPCIDRRKNTRIANEQEKFDAAKAKREEKKLPQSTPEAEVLSQWAHLLAKPSDVEREVSKVAAHTG